jgi:hypothetical protein
MPADWARRTETSHPGTKGTELALVMARGLHFFWTLTRHWPALSERMNQDLSGRVGFANRRPFPCRSHLAFSRMRDRKDFTHILGKRLAKALGIGRHWTPLVPLNGESLSNRLAAVCYADDSQCVAIGSQERRNDRHPLSSLREREQGVRLTLGGDRGRLCDMSTCRRLRPGCSAISKLRSALPSPAPAWESSWRQRAASAISCRLRRAPTTPL